MTEKRERCGGTEEWALIPGYDGYEVSTQGRLRCWRSPEGRLNVPRIKQLGIDTAGYPFCSIAAQRGGKKKTLRIHQLILLTFIGEPAPGEECRHLDGNKTNNRLVNLAWGSRLENSHDIRRHGRQPTKFTEVQVLAMRAAYKPGLGRKLERQFGVSHRTFQQIVKGERWKHLL